MNASIQCGILFALLLNPGTGWSAPNSAGKCLSVQGPSSPSLVSREFLAVAIDLPADARGPITSTDSGDYLWQTPGGDIRVLFDKDPSEWPNTKLLKSGSSQSIKLFRWKDYAKKDLLLG